MTPRFVAFATALLVGSSLVGCSDASDPKDETHDTPNAGLVVESTSPAADADEVALDAEIRVVFSAALDLDLPADAVRVVSAAGDEAAGRLLVDGRTLVFVPARYAAEATYTVEISAAVKGPAGALGEPYTFSFTTGTTNSDQSKPPAEDVGPLGRARQSALGRMPEYALLWSGSGDQHLAVEDPPYLPAPLPSPGGTVTRTTTLESLPSLGTDKRPLVAQLDDDGWDELVVLTQDAGAAARLTVVDTTASEELASEALDLTLPLATSYDLAAGDFDADGRDEVVIVTANARDDITLEVLDYDPEAGFTFAATAAISMNDADAAAYVKVAAGDVDADGRAEAVVLWQGPSNGATSDAYYVVRDDLDGELAELFPPQVVKAGLPTSDSCHDSYVEVAVSDLDGDGRQEPVFGLTEFVWEAAAYNEEDDGWWDWFDEFDTGPRSELCRMDDSLLVAGPLDGGVPAAPAAVATMTIGRFWYHTSDLANDNQALRHPALFHTADLDGDLVQEVVLHNQLLKLEVGDDGALAATAGWPVVLPETLVPVCTPKWGHCDAADLGYAGATRDSAVGDVDADLREDLVLLRRTGTTPEILHLDVDASGAEPVLDWRRNQLQQAEQYAGYAGEPRLALPNVDNDSVIVERVGHDVYLGDSVVVAVLAAAPCSAAAGQDPGACSTELGQGTTEAYSDGAYVNASAGVVVGLEFEPKITLPIIAIELGKIELEASIGVEGSYQHTWGTERSELFTYSAGADNNLVVFESYVYDRYTYRVVVHPEAEAIGETFTINVPTGRRTMAAGQDYYNASNGTGIDIDASVLGIVPGDLDSYPTRSEAMSIVADEGNELWAMSSKVVPVPVGASNATSIELGVSQTESDEFTLGAYVNSSVKVCGPSAGGWSPQVCGGLEASISGGYAYTHEWSNDLVFAGTVSGLPAADHASLAYSVGLYAYRTTLVAKDGEEQSFMVVSYFVE